MGSTPTPTPESPYVQGVAIVNTMNGQTWPVSEHTCATRAAALRVAKVLVLLTNRPWVIANDLVAWGPCVTQGERLMLFPVNTPPLKYPITRNAGDAYHQLFEQDGRSHWYSDHFKNEVLSQVDHEQYVGPWYNTASYQVIDLVTVEEAKTDDNA